MIPGITLRRTEGRVNRVRVLFLFLLNLGASAHVWAKPGEVNLRGEFADAGVVDDGDTRSLGVFSIEYEGEKPRRILEFFVRKGNQLEKTRDLVVWGEAVA